MIDGLAYHIDQPAEHCLATRHSDRGTGIPHAHTAFQPGRFLHRDTAHGLPIEVLMNL